MPESRATRRERWVFNLFSCWRGTGARVTHIGADGREVRVRLRFSWRSRNNVGTIFGGSVVHATVEKAISVRKTKPVPVD